MYKEDLWCGYCGVKEFYEVPGESKGSCFVCVNCKASFEENPGYGYFTTHWGTNSHHTCGKYSLGTGELLDPDKLPRTPEGIVRHSDSLKELEDYLERTQIQ